MTFWSAVMRALISNIVFLSNHHHSTNSMKVDGIATAAATRQRTQHRLSYACKKGISTGPFPALRFLPSFLLLASTLNSPLVAKERRVQYRTNVSFAASYYWKVSSRSTCIILHTDRVNFPASPLLGLLLLLLLQCIDKY